MINIKDIFDKSPREPDSDLEYALEYNPQDGFEVSDITNIHATIPGENDEFNWYWVVELKDGCYALIVAGCDYTGWD